jgi:excisionase family DNA binding protein
VRFSAPALSACQSRALSRSTRGRHGDCATVSTPGRAKLLPESNERLRTPLLGERVQVSVGGALVDLHFGPRPDRALAIKALTEALAIATPAALGQAADLEREGGRYELAHEGGRHGAPPVAPARDHEPAMTLGQAAAALELSTSTLRRWADAGQIRAIRTSGGHRRFPTSEVRRLQAARHRPKVRSMPPRVEPLPALSELLATAGTSVVAAATQTLYDGAHTGWFASTAGRQQLERWTLGVAADARSRGARSGRLESRGRGGGRSARSTTHRRATARARRRPGPGARASRRRSPRGAPARLRRAALEQPPVLAGHAEDAVGREVRGADQR